jgi:hypothetical protein
VSLSGVQPVGPDRSQRGRGVAARDGVDDHLCSWVDTKISRIVDQLIGGLGSRRAEASSLSQRRDWLQLMPRTMRRTVASPLPDIGRFNNPVVGLSH